MKKTYTIFLIIAETLLLVGVVFLFFFINYSKLQEKRNDALLHNIQSNEKEIPQKSFSGKPAFLTNAFSKDGKNYISVDEVQLLSSDQTIQSQIATGQCTLQTCFEFPGGSIKNENPLVRTFEVDPKVIINVSGTIFSHKFYNESKDKSGVVNFAERDYDYSKYVAQPENHQIIWNNFRDIVSSLSPQDAVASFEKPLTFIMFDLKEGKVIKIDEPYQE